MEDIQSRISEISSINNYRFKSNVVIEIIKEFKDKISNKNSFQKAVEIDTKHHPVSIKLEKIIEIIDEFEKEEKFSVMYTPSKIVDGYGNIAVSYDGNPYTTVRLLLMALRTHNNIVFFTKRYYAINTKIVETLNMIIQKNKYTDKISMVEFEILDNVILECQNNFDLLVLIGEKKLCQALRKKLSIPIIYNGYGNVDVFVENREFKNLLLDINSYAYENDIDVSYFDNTTVEETLKYINRYEFSDCLVILSKNTEIIYKFISEAKVKNIYVNKNPFEDYKFTISEKDLRYRKDIFMN